MNIMRKKIVSGRAVVGSIFLKTFDHIFVGVTQLHYLHHNIYICKSYLNCYLPI